MSKPSQEESGEGKRKTGSHQLRQTVKMLWFGVRQAEMDSSAGANSPRPPNPSGRLRVGIQNNRRPAPVGTLGAVNAVTQATGPRKMSPEPYSGWAFQGGPSAAAWRVGRNHSLQNRSGKATRASG